MSVKGTSKKVSFQIQGITSPARSWRFAPARHRILLGLNHDFCIEVPRWKNVMFVGENKASMKSEYYTSIIFYIPYRP